MSCIVAPLEFGRSGAEHNNGVPTADPTAAPASCCSTAAGQAGCMDARRLGNRGLGYGYRIRGGGWRGHGVLHGVPSKPHELLGGFELAVFLAQAFEFEP